MADLAFVKQQVTDLGTDLTAVEAAVAALKAQLASGVLVSQADLDALSSSLTPVADRLKALAAAPVP